MFPILFYVGSKGISSFGVFSSLGYISAILIILFLSKKHKLPLIEITFYAVLTAAVGLMGGKLTLFIFQLIRNFSYYVKSPKEIFTVFEANGPFYGGLIAGILFSIWYLNKLKLGIWIVGDVVAPGIALGHSIGRIGCFLGGCCYGRPSSLPWAVIFPHHSQSVHPTQLYESGLNFLNFVFLVILLKKKKFNGQIFCSYMISYSLIRFFIEFYRGDLGRGYIFHGSSVYTSLSIPQFISLIGLIAGIAFYAILRKRSVSKESPAL